MVEGGGGGGKSSGGGGGAKNSGGGGGGDEGLLIGSNNKSTPRTSPAFNNCASMAVVKSDSTMISALRRRYSC